MIPGLHLLRSLQSQLWQAITGYLLMQIPQVPTICRLCSIKGGDKHDCLPPPNLCRYYFFVSSSASLQSRMYLAASSALIPAKNVLTQDGTSPFGTIPTRASMLIPKEREKCATVSSFGLVFPRSKSEMLRSVVPSFSANSICVRPSSRRALLRAAPKRLQISCIPSPFPIAFILI